MRGGWKPDPASQCWPRPSSVPRFITGCTVTPRYPALPLLRGSSGWEVAWTIYSLATAMLGFHCQAPHANVILGAGLGAAWRDGPAGAGGGRRVPPLTPPPWTEKEGKCSMAGWGPLYFYVQPGLWCLLSRPHIKIIPRDPPDKRGNKTAH